MTLLNEPPAPPAAGAGPAAPASAPTRATGGNPPAPGHPISRFVTSLGQALDSLASVPTWSMTPAEQRDALLALHGQRARLAELELRVLVAADRNQVGADEGATSTAAWLAHATKTTRSRCFADVALAEALDGPFAATRRALAAGDIDEERAAVVVHAVRALTDEHDDLPDGTHATAEAHLLSLSPGFDAVGLRRIGKRLFEVVCPGAADAAEGRTLAAEEERARRLAYVTTRDNGDGTCEGRFRLPTLHAQLLRTALQALTSPRRLGSARLDPATGRPLPGATLLGQGLMDLLEHHLNLDTMPGAGGSPFTMVVTVSLEALRTGLGIAEVDTRDRISAGQARHLACAAGIIPMVLDGDTMALDLGRQRRLFDKYQRIAAHHRDRGCATVNCDRPSAWTEIHHKKAWAAGGPTDLANAIPLCPPHHHMADNPQSWTMTHVPGGGVRFTRRQ